MRRPLSSLVAAAVVPLLVAGAARAAPTVTLNAVTNPTNNPTPPFSGTAQAASGTVTVKVYAGSSVGAPGSEVQTGTATPNGMNVWSVGAGSPALTTDGQYTVQAEQTDGSGTGMSPQQTFTFDKTPPVVTLTGQASPTGATPTFSGTAGTASSTSTTSADSPTVSVKIHAGPNISGTLVQTRPTTRSGAGWSVAGSPALSTGQYTAEAEQLDAAGNTGTSTAVTFNVDATGPAVSLTAPVDGSATNDTTPAISGGAGTTAATSTTSADSSTVFVKVYSGPTASGSPYVTQTADGSTGSWVVTAALPAGTYTVQADQSDGLGNKGLSAPHTFTVDTDAPETTISSRTISGASATFEFTATETASFECRLDGGAFSNCTSPATYSNLPLGLHTFEVRSIDRAGNVDQTSATATWQVEAATPAPAAIPTPTPAISLLKPFPIVRMAGRITRSGVVLTAFEVVTPPGSQIDVRCSGRGCPTRRQSIAVKVKPRSAHAVARAANRVSLTRFRVLRVGLVIEIRITKPGTIGKYTRFRIKRGRLPSRSDACLTPGKTNPVECPS